MPSLAKSLTWKELIQAGKEGKVTVAVGRVLGLYADLRSFNLERPGTCGIAFCLRYKFNKINKRYYLPKGISLSDARIRAMKIRLEIEYGKDPREELDRARKLKEENKRLERINNYTSKEAGDDFIREKALRGGWRWKAKDKGIKQQYQRAEKHVYPVIGNFPISKITPEIVADLLNKIYEKSPSIERKVHTFIANVFREVIRTKKIPGLHSPFNEDFKILIMGRTTSTHRSYCPSYP